MRDNVAQQWISEWRDVVNRVSEAVRATLLDPTPHGHDMRQMTRFAGLLSDEERNATLAAVDALVVLSGSV